MTAYTAVQMFKSGYEAQFQMHMEDSVMHYRRSIEVFPITDAYSNLLTTMSFMSQYGPEDVFEVAVAAGKFLEEQVEPHVHFAHADPDRKLEIGYLVAPLGENVMLPHVGTVLQNHDRENFGIHTYYGGSDRELFDLIVADKIDILINPIGHWAHNRLAVFARKPAPVQVAYLVQSLTSGLTRMDYTIADRWLDEDGKMQEYSTEKVVHLPSGFQALSFLSEPEIGPLPSEKNGYITFASFNNPMKTSEASIKLWTAVLDAVPGSKMLVKEKPPGWEDERVTACGQAEEEDYLPRYNDVDIILDTTPFTGGQTTLDALWMGVPVVTLVGDAVYGRYSYSHLQRIGQPGLVCYTEQDYVKNAVGLTKRPEWLKTFRRDLRSVLRESSILDGALHTRELEEAYRTMWRKWCS